MWKVHEVTGKIKVVASRAQKLKMYVKTWYCWKIKNATNTNKYFFYVQYVDDCFHWPCSSSYVSCLSVVNYLVYGSFVEKTGNSFSLFDVLIRRSDWYSLSAAWNFLSSTCSDNCSFFFTKILFSKINANLQRLTHLDKKTIKNNGFR